MLSLEDTTMLADFADEEIRQPSPRKIIDQSRTIYQSRKFRRPLRGKSFGLPILCDFGEARIGRTHNFGPFVQPDIYRATWNTFSLCAPLIEDRIWDLFEGRHLFKNVFDKNGNYDPFKHIALMVALIGPPPAVSMQRSETTGQCSLIAMVMAVGLSR